MLAFLQVLTSTDKKNLENDEFEETETHISRCEKDPPKKTKILTKKINFLLPFLLSFHLPHSLSQCYAFLFFFSFILFIDNNTLLFMFYSLKLYVFPIFFMKL